MTQKPNRFLLVALFAILVLVKIPSLLDGRLWAEDGFFLVDALRLPWWQALVTPHTGYIDITASGVMLIATHVTDLEHVAWVSVLLALCIQICPAILLITSRCEWLKPQWVLIIALLLLLAPPVSEEVWISPVTSQYHLMVCAALILAFDMGSGPGFLFRNSLLGLASLTGPGPALLAPLFVLRALVDRSWRRALQASILSAGALIEIAVFCAHPEGNRQLVIDLSLLASVIYLKHIILPFFGRYVAYIAGTNGVSPFAISVSLVAMVLVVAAALKARAQEVVWLAAAALLTMMLSYLGSLGDKTSLLTVFFGQRYYYAPQAMLGLTLLGIARTGRPVISRSMASVLVGWLLLIGAWQYNRINPVTADGPAWSEQIAMWRTDPERAIILWPPTMQIQLPR